MRRISIVSVLVLIGCSGVTPQGGKTNLANPCSNGTYARAIACIDSGTLKPSPDPLPANKGGHVDFWFDSGKDQLTIDSEILVNVGHDGPHAWADVSPNAVVKNKYKYHIHKNGQPAQDPEIIIDY